VFNQLFHSRGGGCIASFGGMAIGALAEFCIVRL
jgi:hypothetical protein